MYYLGFCRCFPGLFFRIFFLPFIRIFFLPICLRIFFSSFVFLRDSSSFSVYYLLSIVFSKANYITCKINKREKDDYD
eukprot:UN19266